jgi:hypothetical protein
LLLLHAFRHLGLVFLVPTVVGPALPSRFAVPPPPTETSLRGFSPRLRWRRYAHDRASQPSGFKEVMATAEQPGVVADTVLEAAIAARPKLRYTAGGLANRLRLLRIFAPAGWVDTIRKDLRLDAPTASLLRTPVLEK